MKLRDLIAPAQADAAESALAAAHIEAQAERDPIILKVLTGFSAWVASLFLLGFVIVGIEPDEEVIVFLGAVLTGLAILAHYMAREAGTFVQQSTLSCMMCGHLMLLFGILIHFDRGDELLTLAITQTLLCALPIWVFRRSAYQASALLLTVGLWTGYSVEENMPTIFRLLLAIQLLVFATSTLWLARRSSFAYALALSIGASIFFLDWIQSESWIGRFEEPLWPSNLIVASFIAAIAWRFTTPKDRKNSKMITLFIILLSMAFLSSPGLLYTIALLI